MTGKDAAVIDYLNREASVHHVSCPTFFRWWIRAVNEYRRRGFQEPHGLVRLHRRTAPLGLFWPSSWPSTCAGVGVEVIVRHIEQEKMGR